MTLSIHWSWISVLLPILTSADMFGGLYPRESPSREVRILDGIWDFRLAPLYDPDKGFREEWFLKPLKETGNVIKMAVPSSFNDVTNDKNIRDHVGWVWYDTQFYVPKIWIEDKRRIVIRISSAHYFSMVYINGHLVTSHEVGHLPVMAEISQYVGFNGKNLITIAINNTLTPETIPQGEIHFPNDILRYPMGYFYQSYNFDFFNYAGIHRHVHLYSTPRTYIEDITVKTDTDGTDGTIFYSIKPNSTKSMKELGCSLKIYSKRGKHLKSSIGCIGTILITDAKLWWPYLMHPEPGYQYTLIATISDQDGNEDIYPQKVGIRSLGWNSTTITINNKRIYLKGCGKHEDSDIRGKGLDYALIVKDFSLLKWLGANSFRTSHYPYAEEIMDMADEEGIMVIDESPAVDLTGFGDKLLQKHITIMEEMYYRDKNRPSVVMWSVGNEPRSQQEKAKEYFKSIISATKALDQTRPVTCVLNVDLIHDKAGQSVDVILINRYYGWYSDTGRLDIIKQQIETEVTSWYLLYGKPVIISEYGAGTLVGTHKNPATAWSEEYQIELMNEYFKAFDVLRTFGFFAGEMIWNFADFETPQDSPPESWGILTRERQTKMAAHVVKARYWSLQNSSQQTLNCVTS